VFSNKSLTEKEHKKHAGLVDNIDTLVDDVFTKNKGSFSDAKIEKKRPLDEFLKGGVNKNQIKIIKNKLPVRKILAIVLTFILIFVVIPTSLPYLYGNYSSDVSISLAPRDVHYGDLVFVNATIPASYRIRSVTADMGGIETVELSLIDNSAESQLWQAVWTVHDVKIGEYFATIKATGEDNTSYSSMIDWSVSSLEVVTNETENSLQNDTSSEVNNSSNEIIPPTNASNNGTSNVTVITELHVWDDTDYQKRYVNDTITFYANYGSSNQTIKNATCLISFDEEGWSKPVVMNYSGGLYLYSRSFSKSGIYEYDVSCSAAGYENKTIARECDVSSYEVINGSTGGETGKNISLTKPQPPTNFFAATYNRIRINLSWIKGTGANNTYIVRKIDSYPTNRTDGTIIYNGTGTSYSDTELIQSTRYYYRAWSYAQWIYNGTTFYQWSDDYASVNYATPTFSNPSPNNGSTGVDLQPQCAITINDTNGDTMTLFWYENSTGSWVLRQTDSSCANGTYRWTFTQASSYNTKYWWKVYANNSINDVSAIYHFTTVDVDHDDFFTTTSSYVGAGFVRSTLNYEKAWKYIKNHIGWRLDAFYGGSWHNDIAGLSVLTNNITDGKEVSLDFTTSINPSARYRAYFATDLPAKWFNIDTINTTISLTHTAFGHDFNFVFNYSDLKQYVNKFPHIVFDRGFNNGLFWFSMTSTDAINNGVHVTLDPSIYMIGNSVVSTYNFDLITKAKTQSRNEVVRLNNSQYYASVAGLASMSGYVRTFRVFNSNGTVQASNISSYRYDASDGLFANILQIPGTDKYAIAYLDAGTAIKVITVRIWDTNGTIQPSIVDTISLSGLASTGSVVHFLRLTTHIYVINYQLALSSNGCLDTIWINSSGTINNTVISTERTYATVATSPDMCIVDSDTIAIVYSNTVKSCLVTYNITGTGAISATNSSFWTFDAGATSPSTPDIYALGSNKFAIAYVDASGSDPPDPYGILIVCNISNTGTITKSTASTYTFDEVTGAYPYFFNVSNSNRIYGIAYQGTSGDGWINTFGITSTGRIDTVYDRLEFDSNDCLVSTYPNVLNVANQYYLITYSSTSNDKAITVNISLNGTHKVVYANSKFVTGSGGTIDDTPTEYNNGRKIARDSNGTLYCVFYRARTTDAKTNIVCGKSTDNGTTWTCYNITNDGTYAKLYPSIAIDSNNKLHVVWQGYNVIRPARYQIEYSNSIDGGITWSTKYNISRNIAYHQYAPSIAIDSSNVLYVVWYGTWSAGAPGSSTNIRFSKSTNSGLTWSLVTNITAVANNKLYPSIAIDSNNKLHVVWQGYNSVQTAKYQIEYSNSTNGGTTWSTKYNISRNIATYNQLAPSIAINSTNGLYVVWHGMHSGSTTYNMVRFSKSTNSGLTWSTPTNLTTPSSTNTNTYPSISIDSGNKIHVLWFGSYNIGTSATTTQFLQYRYSGNSGTTWGTAKVLDYGGITTTESVYPGTLWANFPNVSGVKTNIPTQGYAYVYGIETCYVVYARNTTLTWGTPNYPLAPTGFTAATVSTTQIKLAWTKGTNATHTRVMQKIGSYPASISDGSLVYNNTGTSTSNSSLTAGTMYYYRAWSWNSTTKLWSQTYASAYNNTDITKPTSSVDTISPYNVTSSPKTISATASDTGVYSSGVKNVTLWYRWNDVNDSWESTTTIDNTYYFTNYEIGGNEWKNDPQFMVDAEEETYASTDVDKQTEYIMTPNGTGTGTIMYVYLRCKAWNSVEGDNIILRPELGPGDNYEISLTTEPTWYTVDITNDTNAPSPWTWDNINNLACNVISSLPNAKLVYCSMVQIIVKTSTTTDLEWIQWDDVSNPDITYPWSWEFDFPNSTGYYQFYSIARDNASNVESAPGSADAKCQYTISSASINVTPWTWNIGQVTIGPGVRNETSGLYFNLTNDGGTTINVQIKGDNATNATAGAEWKLKDVAGLNNFTLFFKRDGDGDWTQFNSSYETFTTNLASGYDKKFDLRMVHATSSSWDDPMSYYISLKIVGT